MSYRTKENIRLILAWVFFFWMIPLFYIAPIILWPIFGNEGIEAAHETVVSIWFSPTL